MERQEGGQMKTLIEDINDNVGAFIQPYELETITICIQKSVKECLGDIGIIIDEGYQ